MAVKLKREPKDEVSVPDEFIEKCDSLLGYKLAADVTFAKKFSEATATPDRPEGLTVLRQDLVQKYKRSKERSVNGSTLETLGFVPFLLLFIACLYLAWSSEIWTWPPAVDGSDKVTRDDVRRFIGAVMATIVTACMCVWLCQAATQYLFDNVRSRLWERRSLQSCNSQINVGTLILGSLPVPEFVLQTALDVKKIDPSCVLYVDQLIAIPAERTKREPISLDPFLVAVTQDGQEHYLEVWNEPGFKQQRMI